MEKKSLMDKTKEELLDIIFRKDALEMKLKEKIKGLQAKLYVQITQEKQSPKIIDKLKKEVKIYRTICLIQTILVIFFLLFLLRII
ncbi:MAG: hypothetical protein IKP36_12260 [Bacteroidaceae bacterium]|nr:hypothetical protein [Bacteroidaceae bacterium]